MLILTNVTAATPPMFDHIHSELYQSLSLTYSQNIHGPPFQNFKLV